MRRFARAVAGSLLGGALLFVALAVPAAVLGVLVAVAYASGQWWLSLW